ncbi:MAG: methyltransferase domain-containing protein [Micromonosporaceae bacterium]|nr:methyltransferase domain-containing protein [Micromonosporaceae bacterium]
MAPTRMLTHAKRLLKRVLYGRRYDHVPWPQQLYLRPGERQIRRLRGAWRDRGAPTVSLADFRAATPLGEIEEFISCPLCSESRQQLLYQPRNRRRNWTYRVVRCPGCGFLYRNPNIRPEHLGDLYATGYSSFLTGRYARHRQRRYRVVMDALSPIFDDGRGRRLLDFGCGAALFLELAEQRGFEAYGVDLSPDSLEQARKRLSSARVFHGSPDEAEEIAAGGFHVITMWSVMAHLPRPHDDLSMLRRLLADDGVLVIFTVNAGSLHLPAQGNGWFGFTRNHLMFYSRDTLPTLLADTGFAGVGFAPFYGAKVVAVDRALTPRQLGRLKRRVDSTDFGSMLVAVGFATETAAERWGAQLPDVRRLAIMPPRCAEPGPGRPAGHGAGAGARSPRTGPTRPTPPGRARPDPAR